MKNCFCCGVELVRAEKADGVFWTVWLCPDCVVLVSWRQMDKALVASLYFYAWCVFMSFLGVLLLCAGAGSHGVLAVGHVVVVDAIFFAVLGAECRLWLLVLRRRAWLEKLGA